MARPKIPVDLKALSKASQVFEDAAGSDMTIEVLVDASASRELVALCRKVLTVTPGSAELSVTSFGPEMPKLNNEASLTIVIAGASVYLRRMMEIALWSGHDCVVFAEDAAALVATVAQEDALEIAKTIIEVDVQLSATVLEHSFTQWCLANLPDLRINLGTAFVYMRRAVALDFTRQTSLENGVIAAIFFLPGADLPLLTLNQCKLLYQIAVTNEVPLTRDRLVEAALVVVSAFGLRGLTRLALRKLAPVGWLVRGSIAFGATMAMGHVAYEMYSRGGGVVDLVKDHLSSSESDETTAQGSSASQDGAQTPETQLTEIPSTSTQKSEA